MLVSNWRQTAILLLAVCAVYGNALLWGVFQFDDYNIIVGNSAVHSWQAWWQGLGHGIRPLLKASYTLDWSLGGGTPVGFHLTNLLIHVGNGLLVWRLSILLLRQSELLARHAAAVGFVTALLFVLHPVHTEAVSYISGRSSSLMTLFYLGGMLCHLIGRQRESPGFLHLATPLLFLAALATKETAITFPLALLLVHVTSGGSWRLALAQSWSSWLVAIASLLYFLHDTSYSTHLQRSLNLHDGWSAIALQIHALAYLLSQWCWPFSLNIDPDLRSTEASSWQAALLLGILLAAMGVCHQLRQRCWLGFALSWLLLHLLLVYVFAPRVDIANERQLYLVSWPLLLAITAELALWLPRRSFVLATTGLVILAGGITLLRNEDYRSELALWQATVVHSPDKARVHNNLGYAYFLAGQLQQARKHYLQALALQPDHIEARYNLQLLETETD